MTEQSTFERELEDAINRAAGEHDSNTPDFILAQYLTSCLAAFNAAVQQRETWYGRDARPSMPFTEARRLAEEVVRRDDTKLTEALLADAIGHLVAELEELKDRLLARDRTREVAEIVVATKWNTPERAAAIRALRGALDA